MALELTRNIAEGLGAAHAKGMVHRDIKPENVLMAREGNALLPKIADFGIVATKEGSVTRTRTGASLLTYPYAAPEQWRGLKSSELDGRTDIYALGGLLFEMLTGETVFDAESYEGWAEQHKNAVPRPPGSVRPDLADWCGLDALVLRMLAKDRDDRPANIAEVLAALAEIRHEPKPFAEPNMQEATGEPGRDIDIFGMKAGASILGRYRIVRKLSEGGLDAVYRAVRIQTGEPLALRFLPAEFSRFAPLTGTFRTEVERLRHLRHRNVVRCQEPEQTADGTLVFPMELVDGPDLAEFLRAAPRPFDVRLALNLTRGIAEGLGAAHALGLVHRDIKPYNILMERHETDWTPKITGFGTFVAVTSSQMHAGTAGGVMLTAPYAAPEQWGVIPPLDLDGRTDFYGLGGVLFEMLTGETVFAAEDFPGWSELHQHAAPRPLSSVRPDLAQWKGLDALVLRMLAKDREDRPQNASELLSLLDAISNVPQPRRVTVREEPTP